MTHSVIESSILGRMADPDPAEPPLTAKGRATRDRIIDCAMELMLSEGFSGLSIDNVRKAASVSGSQMTHYFADKNSLLRAIVCRRTKVLLDFHRQPALRDLDTFEDFERWAELTMRFGRRKTRVTAIPPFGPLVGELSKCDTKTRDLLAEGYLEWSDLLTAGLQRMKDRGELVAEANPEQLAFVLMSAHQGGDVLSLAYRRPWPDREALKFVLGYLRLFAADAGDRSSPPSKATRHRARRNHKKRP
jgi:AcrR family transcriptional regulator